MAFDVWDNDSLHDLIIDFTWLNFYSVQHCLFYNNLQYKTFAKRLF